MKKKKTVKVFMTQTENNIILRNALNSYYNTSGFETTQGARKADINEWWRNNFKNKNNDTLIKLSYESDHSPKTSVTLYMNPKLIVQSLINN